MMLGLIFILVQQVNIVNLAKVCCQVVYSLASMMDILVYQIVLKMIAMKIDTKIILFEKIETLIILLFVTIIVTSFILLLFFNIFYLSDFIRMGIFLFILIIFIVSYALVFTAFEERIEYYKEEQLRLCQYGTNKKQSL